MYRLYSPTTCKEPNKASITGNGKPDSEQQEIGLCSLIWLGLAQLRIRVIVVALNAADSFEEIKKNFTASTKSSATIFQAALKKKAV